MRWGYASNHYRVSISSKWIFQESCKLRVSKRNKLTLNFIFLPILLGLLSVLITLPKANKLLFIFAPSTYLYPLLSETAALSFPARS
jgi:hypothetical protein